MQPIPRSVEVADLDQWVRGCVVAVRPPKLSEGDVWYGVAQNVSALDGGRVFVTPISDAIADSTILGPVLSEVPRSRVRLVWPLCGSVNLPAHQVAVHLQRVALRQWKRSLTPACLSVRIPREWEVMQRGVPVRELHRLRLEYGIVQNAMAACVQPVYYPFYQARDMVLSETWQSVAVNPNIIVVGDRLGKLIIYYRGLPAAYSTAAGKLSPVTDSRFLARIRRQLKEAHL